MQRGRSPGNSHCEFPLHVGMGVKRGTALDGAGAPLLRDHWEVKRGACGKAERLVEPLRDQEAL